MTTVSVQPTTSEPNEREAFREWWNTQIGESVTWTILERFAALSAWQHQQKRIDELEEQLAILKPHPLCDTSCLLACKMEADAFGIEHERAESLQAKLNEKDNFIKLMDVFGGYEKLQAKLTIAVSIINVAKMDANFHSLFALEEKLSKALAEIKRIGK